MNDSQRSLNISLLREFKAEWQKDLMLRDNEFHMSEKDKAFRANVASQWADDLISYIIKHPKYRKGGEEK